MAEAWWSSHLEEGKFETFEDYATAYERVKELGTNLCICRRVEDGSYLIVEAAELFQSEAYLELSLERKSIGFELQESGYNGSFSSFSNFVLPSLENDN